MLSNLNHLAGQKSPYLLQHVDNPVDWYPWASSAFDKARAEQKPILLSIGYSTCHWCHVMAHESFENKDVAQFLNDHYVSIKVDREERPDIDQIYMTAVSAITGQGGWPLTVFLTPEGKPFYGGTYFPPVAKWGSPGFLDLLKTIAQAWKNQREQLLSSSEEITQLLDEQSRRFEGSTLPGDGLLEFAWKQIASQFDANHGGFGHAPKFPMGHCISFLMRFYQRTKNKECLKIVERTLKAIADGGIYDHLGGGFHRYSTDAKWHVPHFEKMLYDQALLTRAFLECYQLTGDHRYAQVAKETLDYVLRDMRHPQGGFFSAEDADSLDPVQGHKTEGAFYVWSSQEILDILGEADAQIFNYAFGIEEKGNAEQDPHGEFIGKNILFAARSIEDLADRFKKEAFEIEDVLKRSKHKLFNERNKRPRPHLDDKILTDWNGLMLGVFAFAGAVLNEPRYVQAAKAAADFILTHLKLNNRLLHSWREEQSDILGTLEDYSSFINGLLDLYEATFDEHYYRQATDLSKEMIRLFEDEKGGFFLTASDAPALILRPKEIYDGAIPSGNSAAALVLMRMHLLTSDELWLTYVEKFFKLFSSTIEKTPSAYTYALSAFDFYQGPSTSIALEGSKDDPAFVPMIKIAYKHYLPNKTLFFRPKEGSLQAMVCSGKVCQKPTNDVSLFERLITNS